MAETVGQQRDRVKGFALMERLTASTERIAAALDPTVDDAIRTLVDWGMAHASPPDDLDPEKLRAHMEMAVRVQVEDPDYEQASEIKLAEEG